MADLWNRRNMGVLIVVLALLAVGSLYIVRYRSSSEAIPMPTSSVNVALAVSVLSATAGSTESSSRLVVLGPDGRVSSIVTEQDYVAVAPSPDGRSVAAIPARVADERPAVVIFDSISGEVISSTQIDRDWPRLGAPVWAPDAQVVAVVSGGGIDFVDPLAGTVVSSMALEVSLLPFPSSAIRWTEEGLFIVGFWQAALVNTQEVVWFTAVSELSDGTYVQPIVYGLAAADQPLILARDGTPTSDGAWRCLALDIPSGALSPANSCHGVERICPPVPVDENATGVARAPLGGPSVVCVESATVADGAWFDLSFNVYIDGQLAHRMTIDQVSRDSRRANQSIVVGVTVSEP